MSPPPSKSLIWSHEPLTSPPEMPPSAISTNFQTRPAVFVNHCMLSKVKLVTDRGSHPKDNMVWLVTLYILAGRVIVKSALGHSEAF